MSDVWFSVAAIVSLIVTSAFFSGSETALTAASRPRLHQLAKGGNRRARLVEQLLERKEKLLGSILLANNLVNILASALATSALVIAFGETGVAYATIAMTMLIVVFAEVLPKTYAIHKATSSALIVAPVLKVVVFVLSPITRTIQAAVVVSLKLFGLDTRADAEAGEQELRGAIELHAGKDHSERDARPMLRGVLDLDRVEVGDIMIHRKDMVALNSDLPTTVILDELGACPFTRVPLWSGDSDNIVGVLHTKAVLTSLLKIGREKMDIQGLMAEPRFIPETTTLFRQLGAFRERGEHIAFVVDEYGVLLGMVTLEDILEEIVGDISDEFDHSASDHSLLGVRRLTGGSYVINGSVTLRDLKRHFGWSLPEEHAATLAGLILQESRQIPEVGQLFEFYGFRFEILRRRRNQITSLRVTAPGSGRS